MRLVLSRRVDRYESQHGLSLFFEYVLFLSMKPDLHVGMLIVIRHPRL